MGKHPPHSKNISILAIIPGKSLLIITNIIYESFAQNVKGSINIKNGSGFRFCLTMKNHVGSLIFLKTMKNKFS
ncbi:hypothetical protein [Cytobacillus oceanisediminis]|uniref:Uncharacterized protein n=1 Tax=Cytobacillus oceanisediminis 2691 TaxID=1196031 RepID=A0A160MEB3_9BACI|nr:hypothetical protein [Cytobacillus oceanisediminis]AND41194.1 hypothetical protein A361_19220 [Cytobacillus oceanisediminis 2691]